MSRQALNLVLLVAIAASLGLAWLFPRTADRPNYDLLLEAQMARSPAYESFDPNPNFADGLTLRPPPPGSIARGEKPLHYGDTPLEAARAGKELENPLPADTLGVQERGARLFTTYCQMCHGPSGLGDGPVTRYGMARPLSMLTGKAVQMNDGEMFHLLTYGQGNMPSVASQLTPTDRWCVIGYVRRLQKKSTVPPAARLADTAKLFQTHCAACHGADGSGTLVRAKVPAIPDFTSRAWQVSQTDLEIINRIEFGDMPQMPTFRYLLTRDQILALAAYIRTIAGAPAAPAPAPVTANMPPEQIFRGYCLACHNVDGRGGIVRVAMPDIPDFTSAPWQASKKDAELSQAILTGGKFMPPMKDKLSPADAEKMVRFVRGFEGGKRVVALESVALPPKPVPVPPEIKLPASPAAPPPAAAGAPARDDVGARVRAGAVIFRQYCIVCHGPDGTGSVMRAQLPPIPDFTSAGWQTEHSDPQLLVSILDGKGTLMPANRGRVGEGQVQDLVAYVRAFGPPAVRQLAPSEFQAQIDAIQAEWDRAEKQMRSAAPPPGKP
jgi:cbb3-type cytochrome c oxidase subunit III